MEGIQHMSQEAPSVIDFESLILERNPFNTSGGFGDVYKARHPQLGLFALKRPRGMGEPGSPNYRHLLHEAALWKAARHPNVLRFLGTWEANDTVYLVSRFLDDGTVMQYLAAHPNADRTKFILDIARGLAYLHELDIVHGDIKGTNILISPTVDALVADFGLAKIADSSTLPSLKGAGSLRWQSPEVLRGDAHRTFSSDVYSFGMTIYEILSGTIPFGSVNPFGVITMVTLEKKRPEPEPKLSPSGVSYAMQWRAAKRSWDDDPLLRPNMGAIVSWLESEGIVSGRIRVICDMNPQFDGYLSDLRKTHIIVTRNTVEASIFQRPLRTTFPKWVGLIRYANPVRSRWPAAGQRYGPTLVPVKGQAVDLEIPQSPSWSQTVINMVLGWNRTIASSTSEVDIWIMSDDGELCPGDFHKPEPKLGPQHTSASTATSASERLLPVILPAYDPPHLIFCSDSIDVGPLPRARITFEETARVVPF